MNKQIDSKEIGVEEFIDAIRNLKSDQPEKKHWIGWLNEYDEPDYSDRGMNRSAKLAYNDMTSAVMLLWLIEAAHVDTDLVQLAAANCEKFDDVHQQCEAIRKQVPWSALERALWVPA